ncbi:MAG: hypothetical protein ACPGVB_04220 [Chitinophagales bacterium]
MSEPKAPVTGEKPLSTRDKILIGGLGALTPIIMNLLVIDLEKLLIHITIISVIAYIIKVAILFYIGGIVAYMNKDEQKPIKLFQLGIYAPAMIIAFMNTNPLTDEAPQVVFQPTVEEERVVVPPTNNGADNEVKEVDTISALIQNAPSASTSAFTKANVMLSEAEKKQIANTSFADIEKVVGVRPKSIRATTNARIASDFVQPMVQNDSMPAAMKLKFSTLLDTLIRSFRVSDSAFAAPVIKALAERDVTYYDDLLQDISDEKQKIDQVKLKDPKIHQFQYPEETPREQFLRGFFGWKSQRLWFLVVGKFETQSDAVRHAKILTQEMNEGGLMVVNESPMDTLMVPRIYRPYGEIVPEYCVVMGRHLDLETAQRLRKRLLRRKLASLTEDSIELWKLP